MKKVFTILLILAFMGMTFRVGFYNGGLLKDTDIAAPVDDVGVQLASQATVICPSYMSYADQTSGGFNGA